MFWSKKYRSNEKVLTTKYIDWKYEHEIRFIYPNDYLQKMDSENGLVKGLFGCNMHIKQIILGNRCKNEQLIAELSKLSKAMNIPFAYGRLKSYEYKIETMSSV